jgi:hypothetical protein
MRFSACIRTDPRVSPRLWHCLVCHPLQTLHPLTASGDFRQCPQCLQVYYVVVSSA